MKQQQQQQQKKKKKKKQKKIRLMIVSVIQDLRKPENMQQMFTKT